MQPLQGLLSISALILLDLWSGDSSFSSLALLRTVFGLGLSRVGLALGFALILGITASFGSLIPMAILHPEELFLKRGVALIVGTIIMVLGLVFLALAGRTREHDLGTSGGARSGFTGGLVVFIFSGLFFSMIDVFFFLCDELSLHHPHAGATHAEA